ncbi:DNA cytosine methyltransferase [Kocuria sp. M1N1S27]|uniref:DNA cytosine methyltransferase n=1 Tax=Kocuria kalidii TaxID=3376283 RepID=UPI00379CDAEC
MVLCRPSFRSPTSEEVAKVGSVTTPPLSTGSATLPHQSESFDATSRQDPAKPTAIDLFAGAGGATQGLIDAGFKVIGAIEFDPVAAQSYRLNHPGVHLWERDICKVSAAEVRRTLALQTGELTLLKACPPCQGFSSLAEGRIDADDPRNDLVYHTIRFVRALQPKAVLLENVPGLGRNKRSQELLGALKRMGYNARQYLVNAMEFGVPQKRKRLIILALKGLRSPLPETLANTDPEWPVTVRETFRQLSGKVSPDDPLSQPRVLPENILKRVRAIPTEGNRFSLPENLQLTCHKNLDATGKKGAYGSYGRLRWDEPAPTMTTRCTTPACGPFLHPEEHRPITLREAAAIQTFPPNYKFFGNRGQIERQIGNAVPVRMAAAIAASLLLAISVK